MLCVTGTGRCGTSLVAQFCKTMGYDPGGGWRDDVNAGLENPQSVQWSHQIHEAVSAGLLPEFLAATGDAMRAFDRPVIKDPRFVSLPHTLDVWLSVRQDLRFLMLYRDEEKAVESSRQYLKWHGCGLPFDRHVANTREAVKRFLYRAVRAKLPLRVLYFPEVLDDYDSLHEALTSFGGLAIDKEAGREAWSGMVRRDLVHF